MDYNEAEAHEMARAMDMAIYYVYLLKKGPTWSPDSTPEIDALQEAHLNNLRRLGEEGKLVLNGPLLDSFQLSGEIRGIGVLKAKSLTEAQEWISTDPMVKVGRLVFELHAWMVAKGIVALTAATLPKAVWEMARKALWILAVALLLGALPLLASACGESRAVAQSSGSPRAEVRLVDVADVALLKGRPARFMFHVDSTQGLRIIMLTALPLTSHSLRKFDAQDGAPITPEDVTLEGGWHGSGRESAYALLTTRPVTPGWYRLDLVGEGRIRTLAVVAHD